MIEIAGLFEMLLMSLAVQVQGLQNVDSAWLFESISVAGTNMLVSIIAEMATIQLLQLPSTDRKANLFIW